MYLRASEMSKQAWSEAVKTNNLEEHMLLDPLYYSFGDKEQKCWGGASKCWGVQNMLGGGGVRTPNIIINNRNLLIIIIRYSLLIVWDWDINMCTPKFGI